MSLPPSSPHSVPLCVVCTSKYCRQGIVYCACKLCIVPVYCALILKEDLGEHWAWTDGTIAVALQWPQATYARSIHKGTSFPNQNGRDEKNELFLLSLWQLLLCSYFVESADSEPTSQLNSCELVFGQ